MKITSAKYIATAVKKEQYPAPLYPEIAFAGRSNVGKSALINALTNRKGLVKTSSTPGKTRSINFFLVNEKFMLVDLPGYGYAKVPLIVRRSWRPMVETYLKGRGNLAAVVLIMDFRLPPTEYDLQMTSWLKANGLPYIPTATKADKVPRGHRKAKREVFSQALGVGADDVIIFSATTGEGRDALWRRIRELAAKG